MKRYLLAVVILLVIFNALLLFYQLKIKRPTNNDGVVYTQDPARNPTTPILPTVKDSIVKFDGMYYSSSNTILMNGDYGPNYFVGEFLSLQDIPDSTDNVIILKNSNIDKSVAFRIVREDHEDQKVKANTMIGEENLELIENSTNRDDAINMAGVAGLPDGDKIIGDLSKGDFLSATFLTCDITTGEKCNKDEFGNIFLLGLYKRINLIK